jgi:hypothetical protein
LREVDTTYSVIKGGDGVNLDGSTVKTAICQTATIESVMRSNALLDPKLKWQSFSHRSGFMRTFPARTWTTPYDARLQPWFASAGTGPKDVVLLIDSSSSSARLSRFQFMVSAAQAVLSTLSNDDRVSVLFFNDTVHAASCFGEQLVRANRQNLAVLQSALANPRVSSAGGTNLDGAFERTATIFRNGALTNFTTGCNRVVVVLTVRLLAHVRPAAMLTLLFFLLCNLFLLCAA